MRQQRKSSSLKQHEEKLEKSGRRRAIKTGGNLLVATFAMISGLTLAKETVSTGRKREVRVLIAYYSWSNNTRTMAEFIQRHSGFDMEELELVTPYIRNYEELLDQVREEERKGYLPPLRPLKSDLSSYDVILVGSPLWIYTLSSPVMSFLKSNNLAGKVVVPFATRGSSPPDRLYAKFAELCQNSHVMKGFDIPRGGFYDAQPELVKWLDNLMNELDRRNPK